MDPKASENLPTRQLRRSTRRLSASVSQAVNFEITPRGPLKRAKRPSKPQSETTAVNGTHDNDSDDEESPKKKSRLQATDELAKGDEPPSDESEAMETQNEDEDENEKGPEVAKGPIKSLTQPLNPSGPFGHHLKPLVVLEPLSQTESERNIKPKVEQPKKRDASPSKHTKPTIPTKRTIDPQHVTVTSIAEYQRKMKAKIPEISKGNHYVPSNYPKPMTTTTRQRTTDSSTRKIVMAEKRQETKKIAVSHQRAGDSSKGFLKYLWPLVLLILLSAGLLLAFKHLPTLQQTNNDNAQSSRSADSGLFVEELSRVELRFPSQRPELWKRSRIHLQRHLDLSHPTEPVSMILTAGVRAQKTLLCLARSIASAFSSALNSSVVVIDGASLSSQDSDQVKMNIDTQLKAAFGGDKLTAVVHRFEELPPGSTLIFYRYCDHETAAFKRAFILFTVLLPEDISAQQTLKGVEEQVRDYIETRFVGTDTAFNQMDADKFSGLWSRVAHLILPVAYEDEIERKGC